MYDTNVPVLRCPQCNKPFDKQASLKRHGYYCRSRKAGARPNIRPRSCISCAKAKARCDNARPECSRCLAKGVECHYPASSQFKDTNSGVQQSNVPLIETESPGVSHLSEANPTVNGDSIFEDLFATGIANSEELDLLNPDINFGDFFTLPQTDNDTVESFNTIVASSPLARQPSTPSNQQPEHTIPYPYFSISVPSYLPIHAPRSLSQRRTFKTEAQRISNLMLHTLKSYPRMMLQQDSLPPFIHPSLLLERIVESDNLEPLNNCISLMHMMNSRVRGSRRLFWRNVRMECERFCEEHLRMNSWELLAAMQALAIYLIIRLEEGETDYNHCDVQLVTAVTLISKQFAWRNTTHNTDSMLSNFSRESKWKEWILEESGRRICVIYQVLNLLVYFEPADMCDIHKTGLFFAQLPSRKQLWEANNEVSWEMATDRWEAPDYSAEKEGFSSSSSTVFGVTLNGILVKLDGVSGRDYCINDDAAVSRTRWSLLDGKDPPPTASWEDWYAGMDGIGGLVMLAVSLLG